MGGGDLQAELALALERIHRPALERQFPRLAGKLHGLEMTFSQLVAIFVVGNEGARTISEIAEMVDLSHNATSRLVDRLVRMELLQRRENPSDRRQKLVRLTERGEAFMPEVRAAAREAYGEMLVNVPDEDKRRLLAILREIETYLPQAEISPTLPPHRRSYD
ncbi:MarR family winged helix-turn-helix transcriptional regulator [Aureimonas mangrovi]|uniref:MarR family winged helix-turn-helix transcriptional regulator n=1 Tax=Aureimonas mangrovi TaxID=2758041 RepID=UPI00163D7186|nr:MarR family transcriptional regulator [Aureimonas mangrovi]